jgi:NTE family protein
MHRTVFQVDLFPARGRLPATIGEVSEREKDIRYSSRTRMNTTQELDRQAIAEAAQRLLAKLPPALRNDPDAQALAGLKSTASGGLDIVHLIYRSRRYENYDKDYEFSQRSMVEHWHSGFADMRTTLQDPRWLNRERRAGGMRVFDLVPHEHTDTAEVQRQERRRPHMQRFRRAAEREGSPDSVDSHHSSNASRQELPE